MYINKNWNSFQNVILEYVCTINVCLKCAIIQAISNFIFLNTIEANQIISLLFLLSLTFNSNVWGFLSLLSVLTFSTDMTCEKNSTVLDLIL